MYICNNNLVKRIYEYVSLLAQLVERETVNLEAVGSIPTRRVYVLR